MSIFVIVNPTQHEWDLMWNQLARIPMNQSHPIPTECEHHGETWQYMGSAIDPKDNELKHTFRHRCHPLNNMRAYIHIPASVDFKDLAAAQLERNY